MDYRDAKEDFERSVQEALVHSFLHFYHLDHSNAAVHTATVRYSPITFRLAEAIDAAPFVVTVRPYWRDKVREVLEDKGLYEEDPGR